TLAVVIGVTRSPHPLLNLVTNPIAGHHRLSDDGGTHRLLGLRLSSHRRQRHQPGHQGHHGQQAEQPSSYLHSEPPVLFRLPPSHHEPGPFHSSHYQVDLESQVILGISLPSPQQP